MTTVAPTMPVVAPISTPTSTMPMPSPPRSEPARWPITSIRSSASRERSSIMPMNTNSGIASSVAFVTTPKMRCGSRLNSVVPKPRKPKKNPEIASVMATGIPAISRTKNDTSIRTARISSDMSGGPVGVVGFDRFGERLQEVDREPDRDQ